MTEQWQELKETIIELRDNDGTNTQQEVCKFLANYMDVLEKQMRDATPEERESVDKYIKSISKPTGVDFWDLDQEPCTDAVSRQAVINSIANTNFWLSSDNWNEIMKAINAIPSINPQKWIPVSERLPETDGEYFVIQKSGRVGIYVFNSKGNSEEYWKRCAIAWMPLSQSHKPESEE